MLKRHLIPDPSGRAIEELLGTLPAELRRAIRDEANYRCLEHHLQDLEASLAERDARERSLGLMSAGSSRIERRAFRRAGIVAASIISEAPARLESICLSVIITIAASQAGPSDALAFPNLQLRQLLAHLTEL